VVGVDPWGYTLRELLWMVQAKMKHDWDGTSTLWAIIANTVRDPKQKKEPFLPTDIHPFIEKPQQPALPITALKVLISQFHGNTERRTSG
jgi:hypothetical protein